MEFAPLPLPSPNTSPIIAPLWIMPVQNFRLILITNNFYYRIIDESAALSEVVALIAESNQNLVEFQPKIAVVITMFLNAPDPGTLREPSSLVSIIMYVIAHASSFTLIGLNALKCTKLYCTYVIVQWRKSFTHATKIPD